jgi:hypothetical protein
VTAADHLHSMQFGVYIPPERVREVQKAMPPVYTGKNQNEATPTLAPGNMGKRGRDQMRIAKRVARDIMESDIPVGHLRGIMRISVGQRLGDGVRARYMANPWDSKGRIESADHYDARHQYDDDVTYGMTVSRRNQREQRRRDLVHEIGHHQDPETHDRLRAQGAVEGRAENYADHFIGATRTNPPSVYDDPRNVAIAGYQRTLYSKIRAYSKTPAHS